MPGRIHTREFKLSLVKVIVNGETTNIQVCRQHNTARWKREYLEWGEAAFTPSLQQQAHSEVEALQARISLSGKGKPWENVMAESFNDTLKAAQSH